MLYNSFNKIGIIKFYTVVGLWLEGDHSILISINDI